MEVNGLMLDIASYLQKQIRDQIAAPRQSKTYQGRPKPVSGKYPTPVSPAIASGTLVKSTKVYWVQDFEDDVPTLAVDFGAAENYAYFVDQGRRPGRYPPLAPIDRWVTQKARIQGIRDEKGRFMKRKTLVFLIRRSIGTYGYAGIHFIDKAIEKSFE